MLDSAEPINVTFSVSYLSANLTWNPSANRMDGTR